MNSPEAKAKKAAYDKIYNAANREKHKSQHEAYYISHREEREIKAKAYNVAHREEIAARARAYYVAHREEKRACQRAYSAAHKASKRVYDKSYRATNLEKHRANGKIYNAAHREEIRAYGLMRSYGLSRAAYNALLDRQGGLCAICGETARGGKGPQVDHDHKTGRFRGILCVRCNGALGMILDDRKTAQGLIVYLEKFNGGG